MTEIQWLVDIILHHKLPGPLMERFVARIGEVEATLSKPQISSPLFVPRVTTQAASTQRILDEISSENVSAVAPHIAPRITVPQEIITSKGNGTSTRGPRKF